MDLIADLTGHRIREGTLYHALDQLAGRLEPFDADLRRYLQTQPVLHFDESILCSEGKTQWIHRASSGDATRYVVSAKRGQKGIEATGVLLTFTGAAVHDGWRAPMACATYIMNASSRPSSKRPTRPGLQGLIDHLHAVKRQVREAIALGQLVFPDDQRMRLKAECDRIVAAGMQANPRAKALVGTVKRGRVKQPMGPGSLVGARGPSSACALP